MKPPSSSLTCSFYAPFGKWLHYLPKVTKIYPQNMLSCSLLNLYLQLVDTYVTISLAAVNQLPHCPLLSPQSFLLAF